MPPDLRRLCYAYLRSELHAAAAELSAELGFILGALSLPPGGAMSPQQRVVFFRRAVPYMPPTFAFCCRTATEWLPRPLSERPEPLSVPPSGIPPELAAWAPPRPKPVHLRDSGAPPPIAYLRISGGAAVPTPPPAWYLSEVPTPPPSPSSSKRSMSPPPGSPPPEEDEATPTVSPSLRVAASVAPVAASPAALPPSLADQVTPASTWHYTLVDTKAKLLALRDSFAPFP